MFTGLNMLVTTIGYFALLVLWYFGFTSLPEERFVALLIILTWTLPLLVPSFILTALFLITDNLCDCCYDLRKQLSVYDPELDKRFILVDGQLKEDPEDEAVTPDDDVETGTNSCFGCFNCFVADTDGEENNTGEQTEMINKA